MVVGVVLARIKVALACFLSLIRRSLCCFRRRRKSSADSVPLTTIGIVPNYQENGTHPNQDWGTWEETGKPQTIEDHIHLYRTKAAGGFKQDPEEPLPDFFQVLWHLDIFRRSFRELSGHTCMLDTCIFCALKELFSQLQFSHESALPPDALRRALAESFFDQQRFQLGFMDDAAECFENILVRIHFHLAGGETEDLCSAGHCIPHIKFAMTLVEQSVCSACGATSEPLPFTQMVHYVSASALISQAKQCATPSNPDLFGQLLKKAGGMGDIRDCPSACGAKIQIRRTLTNHPEIVSVGIVWDSERPSLEHIMALLTTLRTTLRLKEVFHTPNPGPGAAGAAHQLVGVVTYYGKHYSTFFFHTKLKIWIYFDDANVREVGPKWEQVVDKCRRGRYQPLLLLYSAPDGSPIDATSAPRSVTVAPSASKPPLGRRSLTPSPEKSSPVSAGLLAQRRAMTPNPDLSQPQPVDNPIQRPTQTLNDYQNFPQLQAKWNAGRTDLVRRDSGNWSGDRNSASSSSSTSLENPYQYILGKMQHHRSQVVPRSPTSLKGGESSSGGSQCDLGYDSYSLSSTDSLPLQQSLKHNLQLAQIPEGHHSPASLGNIDYAPKKGQSECERLCDEADLLLKHSQETEDLKEALSWATAAAGKARQAMDAPYSNPQAASAARIKHSTCIMQARSLHKRLEEPNGPRHGEGRHSREGSGSHSRQNSRDKGNHSRQNSRELLQNARELQTSKDLQSSRELLVEKSNPPEIQLAPSKDPEKSIEIYATLPKRGKGLLSRAASKVKNMVEDEEYLMYDRPGRSLSRNKPPNGKKDEKRARSEERNNKSQKENNGFVSNQISKEAKKQAKAEEQKQKKQHKVRRKLLMGGLIRRKNRSMPDLREDEVQIKGGSKDDTNVGKADKQQPSLSGYLSEGHLEYSGNPNLERSRLMRKSFHGSKLIQMAKVPPPPPLRTTSQLSKSERPPFPLPENTLSLWKEQEPQSLPPMTNYMEKNVESVTYANGGYLLNNCQTKLVTTAQVHQVASPDKEYREAKGDEEDEFDLPPYPSPLNSVTHSRQASEEFPPPPVEMESLTPSTLLEQLQKKRQQILNDNGFKENTDFSQNDCNNLKVTRGENWLKELQAKQAAIKGRDCPENENKAMLMQKMPENKMNGTSHQMQYSNQTDAIMADPDPNSSTTVKDLKSKFENFTLRPTGERKTQKSVNEPSMDKARAITPTSMANRASPIINIVEQTSKEIDYVPPPSPSSKSSSDVEIKSNLVNGSKRHDEIKRRPSKKKNVTFCEQVVLVATAEDDKVNSYIPNPILERVLRSVLHRDSPHQETKEIAVHSVVPLKRNDSGSYGQCSVRNGIQNSELKDVNGIQEDSNLQQNMKEINESKSAQCVGLPQPERSVTDGPSSGGVNNRPFSFQRMLPSPVPNRPPTRMQLSPQMSNIPYQQGIPNHTQPQQQQNLQNPVGSNNVAEQSTSSNSPYIPMHVLQSYHAEDTYLMARNNGIQQQMANRGENQGLQPLGIARPEMNGMPSRDCEQKGTLHGDYSEFNGLSVSSNEHPVYSQMGGGMQQCHVIPQGSNGMSVQQAPNGGQHSGPMSLPTSQHYSPPAQYSTVNSYNGTTMVPPMNLIQPKTSNMPQYQGLPSSIHNPQYLPHPSSNVGSQSINGQMLNGSHMSALRHQQILQQQQQMQQGLPNYQSPPNLQQQRNLPSPSLHGQNMSSMQPQFAQPAYQRVPTNLQVHGALKNPSPVPNGIHSDQQQMHMANVAQHQLANLQPHSYSTLPTYPSHVPNSTSQQNIIQNQSTTSTMNLMQHQSNNIPSPSLSIKSQMLLNHSQLSVHQGNSSQNQSCYMPLPQKMRSPIVGGAPVGAVMPVQTKRPQGMYQPDLQEYGQHLMKNGRSEVYQRVPNIIHPGEYPAGQQYPPSGPLSPTYPGGPVPNGLTQPQQQQCLAQQPQLSGAAAPLSVKYSPYQHPPMSQQTKAPPGSGPPNQQQPAPTSLTRSPLCSLCRKKQVAAPSIYCTDCDFYMSRFKPRT